MFNISNINSTDVIWNGKNIPCIDLCKGDKISILLYLLAKEICSIVEQEKDLENLTLDCLKEKCLNCNKYGLHDLLQLMIDNDCYIKNTITDLNSLLDNKLKINLDLKFYCVGDNPCELNLPFDNCGNLLTENLDAIFQAIINIICCQQSIINDTLNTVSQESEIYSETLENYSSFTEKSFNSCLGTGNKKVSQHVKEITALLCQLYTIVTLNTEYKEFVDNFDNLSTSAEKQWIEINELVDRLIVIENNNCCKVKCSDLQVGVKMDYAEDTSSLILSFISSYGTIIPPSWVDIGSTITFDDGVNQLTSNITIIQDGIYPFDLSTLSFSETLLITINLKMKNQNITCNKIINQTLNI